MQTQKRPHHMCALALVLLAACGRDSGAPTATDGTQSGAPPPSAASSSSQAPAAEGGGAPLNLPRIAGPKLAPVDEAPRDPSLVAFRTQLIDIVRRKDRAALLEHVDPKIRTDFGDGGGKAKFDPDQYWSELDQILKLGGTFQKEGSEPRFWAPYVYSAWPESIDAFSHVAAVEPEVELRETIDGTAIAILEYDIVRREPLPNMRESDDGSHHVVTADGKKGWVDGLKTRSPVDYRMALVKKDGKWVIEALVGGD
jgi:hypothetical protein